MFNLSIKLWDNHRKEYLYWCKINTTNSSYYTFINETRTYKIGWSALDHPKRYVMCFGIGQRDKNGIELFTGDKVKRADGKIGIVTYFEKRGLFGVKYSGKQECIRTQEIEKIGDIFQK